MAFLEVAGTVEPTPTGLRAGLSRGHALRVDVLEPGVLRVIVAPADGPTVDRTWSIRSDEASAFTGRPRDDVRPFDLPRTAWDEDRACLAGGGFLVEVQSTPLALRVMRAEDGAVLCEDRPTGAWLPFRGGLRHYQLREAQDRHLGLGDAAGPIDRTGRRIRCQQIDALGYDAERAGPLYKHTPFVVVARPDGAAAGLLYETLADIDLDLGAEHSNYHDPYRKAETHDDAVVLYVLDGPRLRDVVPRLHSLIGRPPLLPDWALGFGFTSMHHADDPDAQRVILEFAREARRRRMPVASIHFGSGYTSGPDGRRYVFTWNTDKFPDRVALFEELRALGYHTVANVKPALLREHPDYADLAATGAFVTAGDGAPSTAHFWGGTGASLDFTDPAARTFWQTRLGRDVFDAGFEGVWNDNNEMELVDEAATLDGDGRPLPALAVRPLQALLMTRASRAVQLARQPDEIPYCISRAGPLGIGAVAETWTGDNATSWHTLRWNLAQALSMSLSGMPLVGHDIGGFTGPRPGPELLVRFFQLMALHPRAVMNSWNTDGGGANTPWMHPQVEDAVRAALELRERWRPFLAAAVRRAHETGAPVMAPLCYVFDDPAVARTDDAFLVGEQVLVVPVLTEGARTVQPYLPAGARWKDLHTGELHEGGVDIELSAPLERLNLLLRTDGGPLLEAVPH